MEKRKFFRSPDLPDNRSIIVVSDLHLGSNEDPGTAERFCSFLDFLKEGYQKGSMHCCPDCTVKCEDNSVGKKIFYPPEKLILLGDVLELWDSRKLDRNNASLDALFPFIKMRDMDCDVVYVTGNHDEDMTEILATCAEKCGKKDGLKDTNAEMPEKPDNNLPVTGLLTWPDILQQMKKYRKNFCYLPSPEPHKQGIAESIQLRWNESRLIEICSRHYPAPRATGGELGIRAGKLTYAFVHGQQFDKEQIPYTISSVIGKRFDPVDYLQDLANISLAKQMMDKSLVFQFLMFAVIFVIFLWRPVPWLIPAAGAIIGAVCALLFFAGTVRFIQKRKSLPSADPIAIFCFLLALVFSVLTLYGLYEGLFMFGLVVITYMFVVITLPRLLALVKRPVYTKLSSIKNLTNKTIIEKNLFDPDKYDYQSEVLVFGHTHVSDFTADIPPPKKGVPNLKLLVNTGSWVYDPAKKEKNDEKDCDTFVYIDASGICLLRWDYAHQCIECLPRCKEESISLCKYIKKKYKVKLGD